MERFVGFAPTVQVGHPNCSKTTAYLYIGGLYTKNPLIEAIIDLLEANTFLLPVPKIRSKGHHRIRILVTHDLF
jgi:hypothetical protein